jgi:hypothetical protein
MVRAIPQSKQTPDGNGGLSEHDLYLVRLMLRRNGEWILTTHNSHIVKVEPVGKPLHAASIPLWWIRYADANDLEIGL